MGNICGASTEGELLADKARSGNDADVSPNEMIRVFEKQDKMWLKQTRRGCCQEWCCGCCAAESEFRLGTGIGSSKDYLYIKEDSNPFVRLCARGARVTVRMSLAAPMQRVPCVDTMRCPRCLRNARRTQLLRQPALVDDDRALGCGQGRHGDPQDAAPAASHASTMQAVLLPGGVGGGRAERQGDGLCARDVLLLRAHLWRLRHQRPQALRHPPAHVLLWHMRELLRGRRLLRPHPVPHLPRGRQRQAGRDHQVFPHLGASPRVRPPLRSIPPPGPPASPPPRASICCEKSCAHAHTLHLHPRRRPRQPFDVPGDADIFKLDMPPGVNYANTSVFLAAAVLINQLYFESDFAKGGEKGEEGE